MTKNEFDNLSIGQSVLIKSGPLKPELENVEMKVVAKHILQIPQRLYILNEYRDIANHELSDTSRTPFGYIVEMIPASWEPRISFNRENRESYIVNENSICALYQDVTVRQTLDFKEER